MRILIFLVIFSHYWIASAQKELNYEDIRIELENSSETLCTSLFRPDTNHYVGIVTDYLIIENIDFDPCVELETDSKKNELILNLLKTYNLLDNLYIDFGDGLTNIASNERIDPKNVKINIELNYKSNISIGVISIPIMDKATAKYFISDLTTIFGHKKCFRKLKRKIKG